jgi:hypothetical protein
MGRMKLLKWAAIVVATPAVAVFALLTGLGLGFWWLVLSPRN